MWRLHHGRCYMPIGEKGREDSGPLFRCQALLEQALACSPHADVRFVFDDGETLSGHRGMLCCMSGDFGALFGSVETETGQVRGRGLSRASFRGFLEFVYLGRAGTAC